HVSTSGAGAGASGPIEARLSGVQTYHILRVDAQGGAYAELSESRMSMTMTANGQTTTTAAPKQAPLTVYLGADGSQRGGDSTGALQYVTDTSVSGVPVHMHLSGSLSGESHFGTLSRRQLSATLHMDMHMFMSARAAGTASQGVREHMVIALSMTPATA